MIDFFFFFNISVLSITELTVKKFIKNSVSGERQTRETLEASNTVKTSLLGNRKVYTCHNRVTNLELLSIIYG